MRKKLLLVTFVLLGAVLLSACGGAVRGTTWSGLSVNEDTVYLADVSLVFGVNLKDGREVWRFSDKNDNKAQFYSTPVIMPDGLVIVGSAAGSHTLYALNPQDLLTDGDLKSPNIEWTFTGATGAWVAAPLIVGDMLFAPNSDGNLYVLDLSDGQSQKQMVNSGVAHHHSFNDMLCVGAAFSAQLSCKLAKRLGQQGLQLGSIFGGFAGGDDA